MIALAVLALMRKITPRSSDEPLRRLTRLGKRWFLLAYGGVLQLGCRTEGDMVFA